jgi:co-chaperonin GroES (HSP10)
MEKGEIVVDGQNVVELEKLGISLMAVEDKIIVMFDDYKSGFECKTCNGKTMIEDCPTCHRTGTDRFDQVCKTCLGDSKFSYLCPECKGKGGILVIPDTAKSLPTTGIVVSMGPTTPAMKIIWWLRKFKFLKFWLMSKLLNTPIRLGSRVIFGPHVGTMIPFKGNIKLKIMRVHEPLAVLFGKDTAARDFIDYEVEQY